jgi:hypothetical protein
VSVVRIRPEAPLPQIKISASLAVTQAVVVGVFARVSGMKKADLCRPAFLVFQAFAGLMLDKIRTYT